MDETGKDIGMRTIDRTELERLVAAGAHLVEVLPSKEYREHHIPGAINLPLRRLEESAAEALDRARTVIVYCWDSA